IKASALYKFPTRAAKISAKDQQALTKRKSAASMQRSFGRRPNRFLGAISAFRRNIPNAGYASDLVFFYKSRLDIEFRYYS
ncbi:hypothetical protein, partial [Vibrio paucivorans]